MTLALLAFIAGVMVGALAGAVVVLTAFGLRRKTEARRDDDFMEWLQRKVDADPIARQAAKGEEARLDWQSDTTWEEHA